MSITLAQLGQVLENGTSIRRTSPKGKAYTITIPPRPFLAPAINNNRDKIAKASGALLDAVIHMRMSKRDALGKLGALAQGLVQQQIRAVRSPENAASTVRQKGSSHPLIDSGQLVQNVAWEYEL